MSEYPPCYSRFDDETREFIIEKPDTPRPWENRLWNERLSVQISNHGMAKSFERDFGERYYAYNSSGNRAVYVYERKADDLWSPGWLPVRAKLDHYEARHGINYTIITGGRNDIEVKWTHTVHPSVACELWEILVTNQSDRKRVFEVMPFYQIGLSFRDEYFHGSPDLFRSEWDDDKKLFFSKNFSRQRDGERYALAVTSSRSVDAFELSMEGFLRNYGSLQNPQCLRDNDFRNSVPDRQSPVYALLYRLELMPGESVAINLRFFGAEDFAEALQHAGKLTGKELISEALELHRKSATDYFSRAGIVTKDQVLNRFVNLWTAHQLRYNVSWNREESGIGFRDAMQDCDAYVIYDRARCRERIVEATGYIFADGHTVRKWSQMDLKPYFDGGVWYVNTLCKYLRETGDDAILDEVCPYYDSEEQGTVLDHAKRAMDFLEVNRGPDGLCRMGFGDWNDALNGVDRAGRGQSVWTTMALIWALRSFVGMLEHIGDRDVEIYRKRITELTEILNRKCYEGDRYIRAITDGGEKVGSESCSEGKIYLNAQSWAIIAGVADSGQVRCILKTVKERLYTDYGPVLLDPVYTRHREDIGRITSDPPGFVENGANYVHAAMFHAYALLLAGNADLALEIIHRVLPSNPRNPVEHSCLEPYMITNAYEGPASYWPGRAMFPWRTGSAGWLLKVVWDGMLGICPGHEHLELKPCLPSAFGNEVSAHRYVRGLRIEFVFIRSQTEATASESFDMEVHAPAVIEYGMLANGMRIQVVIDAAEASRAT